MGWYSDDSSGQSVLFDAGNVRPLFQDQAASPVSTALGSNSEIQTQNPKPDLPNSPGPGSPATAPTGPGSKIRSASEAGSAVADGLAAFQLSLTHSSLTDVFRRSDELPDLSASSTAFPQTSDAAPVLHN